MKDRKKPRGIKHKIREEKIKQKRIVLAITVAILITIILFSCFFINSMLNQPSVILTSEPRAAIVDHLSLTQPNQSFILTATNILRQAGYVLDYYPGEKVNVEFYRNLPTHGYSLIILRVHSAMTAGSRSLGLFTSEVRSNTKYVYEQLTDQLVGARFPNEETIYFGISPLFILNSMKGSFQNATIIQMGCDGLATNSMAEAFRQKGAKVYISWSASVLVSHTDRATINLLQHLVMEKQTIGHAVENTMIDVGADPEYKSLLKYYPLEASEQTIENITSET